MTERHPNPRSWSDAFSALPLEAPPMDAWQRIAPRLAPAPRRTHRILPWAIAACTALLAALPLLLLVRQGTSDGTPAEVAAGNHADPPTLVAPPSSGGNDGPVASDAIATNAPATTSAAHPRSSPAARDEPPAVAVHTRATTPAVDPGLARLQAESARLEALVAELARNEPVDGAQLVLTLSLQAQVGDIDAALAEGTLDPVVRSDLWRQRVAALRDLAGVASDQRWDALFADANPHYALVQVY